MALLDVSTLVERCRAGDDLAWESLVRRFQARVYGVAYHYLRNSEDARDAAQEIFVKVYRRLDSYQGGDHFLAWLLRLTRNACIDRLRARRARPEGSEAPLEHAADLASATSDPEQSAEDEARKRLLYRAIDRLSEKNRELILLKEIQGLKIEEISELLSLPVGTVKSRSNRARIELAVQVRRLNPAYGGVE